MFVSWVVKRKKKDWCEINEQSAEGWNRIRENTWGVFSLPFVPYFLSLTHFFVAVLGALKGTDLGFFHLFDCFCFGVFAL